MNRLLSKTADAYFAQNHIGAASVSFTYTATGKRQTMADASGTTTYGYNNRDRLVSEATPEGTLTYAYDAAGDVKTIASSNANGANVAYGYDTLNRLSSVTDANGATGYGYDPAGNLQTVTYPNGMAHTYSYDTRNRLTGLAVAKGSAQLTGYSYLLDAAGHRLSVTELSGRTVNYGYDNLYRLTSETIAADPNGINGAVGYTYDAVGNRKQMTSTVPGLPAGLWNYDANDRLASDVYDADGNTVGSGGLNYAYDFENRLVQQGGLSIIYDGDGNRVSKTVAGATTQYLVDTQNPTGYAQVMDEVQGGAVTRTYTWGSELISEHQSINSTPTTSYYIFDGHGSARALTNSGGTVTDTYDYDAFGNLLHSTGTTPNNYLFAGEQFDPNLNLYYNRARYLRTTTGRFWSMDTDQGDPESPGSLHKYLYAIGNPVDEIDPSGEASSLGELEASQAGSQTIDSAAASEDYQAYQSLTNLIARSAVTTPASLSVAAKVLTWTLAGLILATAASAPYFATSSDAVLTNFHDPDNAALYAFGNNQGEKDASGALYYGPREPRIGGYNRTAGDVNNDLELDATGMLEPNSPQPWPRGASTWDFPTSAKLTGVYWGTRKDYVTTTYGLGLSVDGEEVGGPQPGGHRTVYPTVAMSAKEFIRKWFELNWVRAGTKK